MNKYFSSIIFLISFIFIFQTSLCENIITLKVSKFMRSQIVLGNFQNINTLKINSNEVKTIKMNPTLDDGENIVEIIYKEPLTDCSNLLSGSTCSYADLTNFDSSQCTNFEGMFSGCDRLEKIKFGNFDTSKAENMNNMFSKCSCQNIDFSILKTSQVKTMKQMFSESKIKFLDLSSFDTSNVENMEGMFYLSSCISIDLSSFDTSKVTTMKQMFSTCSQLISLDISNFNAINVQDLNQIFFSMGGKLKFCNNNPSNQILKKEMLESGLNSKENCDDSCFTNSINKFLIEKGECYESCKNTTNNHYEYDNQCYSSCPTGTEEYPENSFFCVESLDCSNSYYSFDKTECIDEIPEGYYCNDEDKKTIDKCQDKCQTCDLKSVENDLCIRCNITGLYYEVENFMENTSYIECSKECPDGYFFENEKCKKCFQNCKKCNELGDSNDNKCKECNDNMIFELGANCYNKCPQNEYYYFDDSNQFHCSPDCLLNYKLIPAKSKCIKECKDEPPYIYQYENTCLESCPPSYHAPNENKICELALHCDKYYNYEHTACLDSIPEGFFLNNSIEKTIDKCQEKCLECNLESVKQDLCTKCNKEKNYYKKIDDLNGDFMQCYKDIPEGYYFDLNELIFKKCYKSCKYCNDTGNVTEQLCNECFDNFTLNGTNCYEICQYYYYFDDNFEYHCSIDENCPSDRSKLIVDKNECVETCFGDYKFEIYNKCYTSCPPNSYYNFDQTNCIDAIPEGFYLNSTQTIDKCPPKCHECNLDSVNNNLCITCENSLNFYKKEDLNLINGYIDCFMGEQDNYYLDINTNLYKRCHKNCKSCTELGNIQNNKCTECFSNSTLNGSNCYEICQYYYYFDDSGEYICTQDENCPNIKNKLNIDTKECIKECIGENKFEFNNKCYKECPENTFYNYEYIGCIDSIPEGYYLNDSLKRTIDKCDIKCENECTLDISKNNIICKSCNNKENFFKKEDDEEINTYYDCYKDSVEKYYLDINNKIYKKCFDKCKYCNDTGNILEHNCTECFQGFTLNDTNCYEICQYFYYFDENNIYHCTEENKCPNNYLIIKEKNECIIKCENDVIYKYEHKGECLNHPYIPKCDNSSMFISKTTGECVESCEADEFLQGYCSLRNNSKLNQDFAIKNLIESIEKGKLNNNSFNEYLIMEENITYHLTMIKNDNLLKLKNNKISSIDFGDCENVLKEKYNINKDLPLITLKIDYFIDYSLIPIIIYEVFDPITMKKLNLSLCNKDNIIISLPTKDINENNIYLYDPNDLYYKDECSPISKESKFDLIISDRQNYFIKNNLSLCEKNCTLIKYDNNTKKSVCSCDIKSQIIFPSMLNKNDLFLNDFSNTPNINVIKCVSTLFSKTGIKKNIAFYIYLLLTILLTVFCVQFYRKGYTKLKSYINNILVLKEKKTEGEIPKMENLEEIIDKTYSKPAIKIIRPRTPKFFRLDFKGVIGKDDINYQNYQDNNSNDQRSINKLEVYNIKAKEINNNNVYNYNLETEINYTDLELNSFTYKEAIGIDLRYFKPIYVSFIKYNHPIISLFTKNNDYNSIYIKASLIIISFSLYYFVNSLFITQTIIHKVYVSGEIYNIELFIPYIIFSFLICYVLDRIMRYGSLSYDNIYSVYKENLYINAKIRANIVKKLIFVKYICFYIIGFLSILLFGYYLAVFGAVYQRTQYILIKNTLISYIISLVFPFFIIIIPSILRRYSLKEATRQNIYKLSKYLQYI